MEIGLNKISKEVICPSSKSYANRILFLAALRKERVKIENVTLSDDVFYFMKALEALGKEIHFDDKECTIIISGEINKSLRSTYLGEGGTTIRFLLCLLASIGGEHRLIVEERFLKRPIDDIIAIFSTLGVGLSINQNELIIKGKIDTASSVTINCQKTTQFATAFLLLKKLGRIKDVHLTQLKSSVAYIDMTKSLTLANKYFVPVDFSSLGYFVVWAILVQDLIIKNVKEIDYLQADSFLFKILDHFDAQYEFLESGLHISKKNLRGEYTVDCSQCLDLIPTLSFLFSYTDTTITFINYENLIYKESNRLNEMLKLWKVFKIRHQVLPKKIILYGSNKKIQTRPHLETAIDHRMIMIGFLFLKYNLGGTITHEEAVKKSFPSFFEIFNQA